ncbi:MAG: cation acetate symporter [Bacteroidetes bacterium GWF2_38_335]|nr:MAG: cation acetate symporter [Bacteroidetes bacterium GWF2_38_335]OFY77594.1 MAG: cation acetate symporter [Bacteroidetes bacterium RIFOXYA12_FULL_38_20]HBS87104.1 cation acetate symporter [Bacteroidales bacterium]
MIYEASTIAIVLFFVFVALVLGLSFYFAAKTKSASGYFAAGGNIHWAVNGIAFAGDYLSAASFLGICGMIAFQGYDGFLYSIGYLAGWIVALFLVAEPLKRLGKYTFADALDAKFNSKAIQLSASISTLVVSLFYLIPQMVGAGSLVTPLLGFDHWVGVVIVGAIVIFIVATAGMTSTTYVQFIKGSLLIVFSTILTFYILDNGLSLNPDHDNLKHHEFATLTDDNLQGYELVYEMPILDPKDETKVKFTYAKFNKDGFDRWFNKKVSEDSLVTYEEMLDITKKGDKTLYNGKLKEDRAFFQVGHLSKIVIDGKELGPNENSGFLNPMKFLSVLSQSEFVRFIKQTFKDKDGSDVTAYYQSKTAGAAMLSPGLKFKIGEGAGFWDRLNFISLMLALFLGTASLPHILIRYYTVASQKAARKSTIVAIAAIGFFYVLTLFMGLGAAVNGVLDVTNDNMSGPLLAKAFGIGLFAIISAIAFATVLGTVSGLIVASSGAIAHDFIDRYLGKNLTDKAKVRAGKIAAFAVGLVAIILGILFEGMNVSYLVGWAFAVAASANLPAILMVLFWKKTTAKGVAWSIIVGAFTALAIILTGPTIGTEFFGIPAEKAIQPLDNPAIISFTLALLTLVFVSLGSQKDNSTKIDIR